MSDGMAETWDCHAHPFGPVDMYRLAPERGYDPPVQSLAAYDALAARLGITHTVFVQASAYGTDMSCLLDAVAVAPDRRRGVCPAWPAEDAKLPARLHEAGIRGLRLNLLRSGPAEIARVRALIPRLEGLGWHLAAFFDATAPGMLDEVLDGLSVPLVLDHYGFCHDVREYETPRFASLLAAVAAGRVFIKLSAPYQLAHTEAEMAGLGKLTRRLYDANPSQLLFGTDWPHIGNAAHAEREADWLEETAGHAGLSAETLRAATAANARRLYQ